MPQLITSAKHKGYELKLFYGENIDDPREWENLGKMLCYDDRYDLLGDYQYRRENYPELEDIMMTLLDFEEKKPTDILGYLPLYLYEHSGLSVHWDYNHFNDRFDTRRIGFYVFTREDITRYFSKKESGPNPESGDEYLKEVGLAIAKKEISEYDKYLSGSITVIDYIIEDPEGVAIDSCMGYLTGDDGITKNTIGMIIDDIHFEDESIDLKSFKEEMSKKLLLNI